MEKSLRTPVKLCKSDVEYLYRKNARDEYWRYVKNARTKQVEKERYKRTYFNTTTRKTTPNDSEEMEMMNAYSDGEEEIDFTNELKSLQDSFMLDEQLELEKLELEEIIKGYDKSWSDKIICPNCQQHTIYFEEDKIQCQCGFFIDVPVSLSYRYYLFLVL
jgi:hypothetical protein